MEIPYAMCAVSAANVTFALEKRSAADPRLCGGDVFEVHRHGSEGSTFLLADVSSKGDLGRRHAELVRRRFRAAAHAERSPARILSALNRIVFDGRRNSGNATFASAIVATVDRRRQVLTYSSGGHEAGILIRDENHRHLLADGPVLGVVPAAAFLDRVEVFDRRARLVVATDGFTECREPSGRRRQFGTAGIVSAALSAPRSSCGFMARSIALSADRFTAQTYRDDATLAVVALDET
jgi:serine phosphatase RsbU (regulator of sigma subunit)